MALVQKPFSDIITFTRASGGGRFNASGQYEWLAADQPRIDYDPATGECMGLLVEASRTNLLLNSATLATQTSTVTATAHTLSFYGTGAVTLSGAATGTLTGTGASNRVSLTFTPAAGALTLTVSGTVSSGQLERGAFPTSYIPTADAQVTRAADVASVNELSPWFNASAGTFLLDMVAISNRTIGATFALSIGSSGTEYLSMAYMSANTCSKGVYISAAGASASVVPGSFAAGARVKIAAGYAADGTISAAADGVFSGSKTLASGSAPAFASMYIGRGHFGGASVNCHIRSIRYYPHRLSDSELQALTV